MAAPSQVRRRRTDSMKKKKSDVRNRTPQQTDCFNLNGTHAAQRGQAHQDLIDGVYSEKVWQGS
jgi:hypothetical protein